MAQPGSPELAVHLSGGDEPGQLTGVAVPWLDVLLVLVLILMLAGTVWGWRQGYAAFDVTTAVWLIVLAIVLLMVIAPWPVRHVYW